MKLSVLLPTRDRLPLLRQAVESVLLQDDGDWEIVISDNHSRDDVAGYVESLGDPRIRCLETERPLPVTDNWNNALRSSSGDYVIMLGDDDALLAGFFSSAKRLIQRFDEPELIYHSALLYAHPGVVPNEPDGYLQPYGYAPFFAQADEPLYLDHDSARELVTAAMNFRVRYGFNMQFVLIGRALINRLAPCGNLFCSPFPDYYAMNLLMLRARSIVIEPRPCVVIGISRSSYGFYHATEREQEGAAMLAGGDRAQSERSAAPLLPGSNINNGWLLAMVALRQELGGADSDLRPNMRRYRMLQILDIYDGHVLRGTVSKEQIAELWSVMSWGERFVYGSVFRLLRTGAALLPTAARDMLRPWLTHMVGQLPRWNPGRDPQHYEDVIAVVRGVSPDDYPRTWPRPSMLQRVLAIATGVTDP